MKIKKLTILSILTLALLNGCGDKEKIDENIIAKTVEKKKEVPSFKLNTTNNKQIEIIADINNKGWVFKGVENKVILLDFFGTWCPPCKAEIPHLNNIRKRLGKDFEIIGVDIGSRSGKVNSPEHMADFIKQFNNIITIIYFIRT